MIITCYEDALCHSLTEVWSFLVEDESSHRLSYSDRSLSRIGGARYERAGRPTSFAVRQSYDPSVILFRVIKGPVAPRYISLYGSTNQLAEQYGSINLGQGFPDFDGPDILRASVQRAIADGKNQYLGATGAAELRRAITRCSKAVRV